MGVGTYNTWLRMKDGFEKGSSKSKDAEVFRERGGGSGRRGRLRVDRTMKHSALINIANVLWTPRTPKNPKTQRKNQQ